MILYKLLFICRSFVGTFDYIETNVKHVFIYSRISHLWYLISSVPQRPRVHHPFIPFEHCFDPLARRYSPFRSPHSTPSKSPASRDLYGDRWIGIRPSGSARARLDFTDVESPDPKNKNKENTQENGQSGQGTRERNLYHALMQNELQGKRSFTYS